MEKFKNLYTINKTLRFELKPMGKTLENIKRMGFLEKDKSKADNRKVMQSIIDKNLKKIIDIRLKELSLSEDMLEAAFSEDVKIRESALKNLKQQVVDVFKKDIGSKEYLDPGKHIKKLAKKYPEKEIIQEYDRFSTYFVNFYDIRKHVLTGNSSGSIAHRLIDDNLNIYINNVKKLKRIPEELKASLTNIDKIDELINYNNFLNQTEIVRYNEILGGIAFEDGTKIQGINEKINLYSQQKKMKLPRLDPLFKMILSDRGTSSFIPDVIEDDEELIEMLLGLIANIDMDEDILLEDQGNIFIKYNQLGRLPGISYLLIKDLITEDYDKRYGEVKRRKSYEEDRKKAIESELYSIDRIAKLLINTEIDILQNIKDKYKELIIKYKNAKDSFLKENWSIIKNIKQSDKTKVIKGVLDSLKDIQRFYSIFDVVSEDKNPSPGFYTWLSENTIMLDNDFNSIYNKSRNYLTRKQYSSEKFKLNFGSPTLAKGWDANKETDNSAFILRKYNEQRKDYDYFLGIWEKSLSKKEKVTHISDNGDYEKMQYKLYPDPSKMMPKQFLSAKWNKIYPVTEEFDMNYKNGKHKKGDMFDKTFLHKVIDRFKHGLVNHEEKYQESFGFKFRETKDYDAYTEFIQDVEKSNYNVSFNKVDGIEELVEDGKLYLFQIWSKDFSVFSKGTKNLNTIYFESLFSDENIKRNVFKLSGEAEIFYRPASLNYDSKTIKKGHHYEELKDKFDYPIIKDKRFSEDKFMFHVPMQINFRSEKLSEKKLKW